MQHNHEQIENFKRRKMSGSSLVDETEEETAVQMLAVRASSASEEMNGETLTLLSGGTGTSEGNKLCTLNCDHVPDLPIIQTKTRSSKRKTACQAVTEEDSENITGRVADPLCSEDMWRQKELQTLLERNKDLTLLQQGAVKCKRRKPPSTEQTKKEAFDRYMKMMYKTPPNIKIGSEDRFDLRAILFPPKPRKDRPCTPPTLVAGFFPDPKLARPVALKAKEGQENRQQLTPGQCNAIGFKPNSVLVARLWPDVAVEQTAPKQPFRLKDHLDWEHEESDAEEEEVRFGVYEDDIGEVVVLPNEDVEPPRTEEPRPHSPPVEERVIMKPRRLRPLSPKPPTQPKPRTPTPPPSPPRTPPTTPTPVAPRTPTPDIPAFLKQFAEEGWFKDMYPDHRRIPGTVSPGGFSVQLLSHLNDCSGAPSKIKILAALQTMHGQGLLRDTDALFKGLIDSVPQYARPDMSPEEQILIGEILNLLPCLNSDSHHFVIKLLTLLAYKKLGLWKTALCTLAVMGVREAELWLMPELESWDSENQPHLWKRMQDRAEDWLGLWTSKYTEHSRSLKLKSTAQRKPLTFTPVDVVNYFCSVRKEEHVEARRVAPERQKDTVFLFQSERGSQPIHRLGESYSMSRIRKPPGIILPPLKNRPFLTGFTNFITLPLHRVSLCPLPTRSDQRYLKASPRRYFILERSYVEYYR